ncbi:heat shock 70 kDa protein 12A-like [Dreissena polymorpha]|uniref:heat shock 70 kDa protein 12A-like n=1 Tax=Dreissena polymorpha TaxID=45954 RepID=UPI00226409BD|nr:heat shock 70 kDa protein 12A-like [Dreissena polymorpha]XP_052212854.1 heat shock 70 kDa protein 12A-like [Dreissena polymorpha]
MALIVASIDFGTTFSGWAYSFVHDHDNNPADVKSRNWNSGTFITSKAPTCVLIKSDGTTLEAFGYDAESKYAELAAEENHTDVYFFQTFKMKLFDNEGTIGNSTLLEDETGKKLKALTVFSLTIKYLVDDVMDSLNKQITNGVNKNDINWVLTVPAIWDEHAKQFMRTAAREAGIEMGHLSLALEPEAASIYCRHIKMSREENSTGADISTFQPGTRYLICDAGGGTVDITVHEVTSDMKLKEIEKASGGAWGGTKVNDAFKQFIDTLAGGAVMQVLKENHMDDFIELMRSFELKKRECKPSASGSVVLRFPTTLQEVVRNVTKKSFTEQIARSPFQGEVKLIKDKLKCDITVVSSLFDGPVRSIVDHLSTLVSKFRDNPINQIVLVGGFSESPLLQEAVRSAFPGKHVKIPHDAGLAVMKGAVIFGHNKRQIVSRIARFTYGIRCAYNSSVHGTATLNNKDMEKCFYKLITNGQSVSENESAGSGYFSPMTGDSCYVVDVYATKEINPVVVAGQGCFLIGSFTVNCKDKNGKISETFLNMYFGGTEIVVKATLETTGEEIAATFDLPD